MIKPKVVQNHFLLTSTICPHFSIFGMDVGRIMPHGNYIKCNNVATSAINGDQVGRLLKVLKQLCVTKVILCVSSCQTD